MNAPPGATVSVKIVGQVAGNANNYANNFSPYCQFYDVVVLHEFTLTASSTKTKINLATVYDSRIARVAMAAVTYGGGSIYSGSITVTETVEMVCARTNVGGVVERDMRLTLLAARGLEPAVCVQLRGLHDAKPVQVRLGLRFAARVRALLDIRGCRHVRRRNSI